MGGDVAGLTPGSRLHYVQCGANLPMYWWVPFYFLPVIVYGCPSALVNFFLWNALTQIVLFIPVVQIPLLLTGQMQYVDIGWPCGLVLLAVNALSWGSGWWVRRWLVCGCLLFHSSRMAVGAIVLFGKHSKFTYRFAEDLPRYKYARVRWETACAMPASGWWIKAQHDTLQQCWTNSFVLAVPFAFCAFNASEALHPLEIVGPTIWLIAWLFENAADISKNSFVAECKRQRQNATGDVLEKLKSAVLGYTPWDGPNYRLWTLCRHPNYFGEWLCWFGFCMSAIPSIIWSWDMPIIIRIGFGLSLLMTLRFFYDCLVYWTGAGPAEYYSALKRPEYREYQVAVRCFFPFEAPCVNHHRVAGWPGDPSAKTGQASDKVTEIDAPQHFDGVPSTQSKKQST